MDSYKTSRRELLASGVPVIAGTMRAGRATSAAEPPANDQGTGKAWPARRKQTGAEDCFSWFSFPGGHNYPPVAQAYSFAWFDRWLGHTPPQGGA